MRHALWLWCLSALHFLHFTSYFNTTFPQHSTDIALLCLQNSTFYWHCLQVDFLYWITRPLREAGWWTLINLFWTSSFSAIEHPSTSNKDWEIAPYMPSSTPKYVLNISFCFWQIRLVKFTTPVCFLACSLKGPPFSCGKEKPSNILAFDTRR